MRIDNFTSILLFVVLPLWTSCSNQTGGGGGGTQVLNTTEAFVTRFTLDRGTDERPEDIEVVGSISGAADLPHWIDYYRRNQSQVAYFYGTPSATDDGDLDLDLVYINMRTYNFTRDHIKYRILAREETMQYEIELKLFELDLEDAFERNLPNTIRDIFAQKIWTNSHDIYVTRVSRPFDVGSRLPLNPLEKEGVTIRLGSVDSFNEEILRIETEVRQIQNRISCPKRYKATSFEYLFREKNLFVDWCSFQLFNHTNASIK